ncbi:Ig-like domain-containing protein [Luteimonas sp. M1R5S18]|uniref:Ig-like domain-containing protein n=1 Tax=Luteimonas rhizosphaericola TaxID=3042024 RepID=A0ABT6JEZ7_9GAMM|nr:Ig-like domain-containing protein [Luteimonas rhizosphaericola]MDH5829256.1 Ig-like domain-containing protein [Luteimonas rhizosphaericola]
MKRLWLAALLLVLASSVHAVTVEGQYVLSQNRTDMVHDARRGVIYIANGSQVRRYQISTRTFLPALTLNANSRAMAIDISADGSTLAVADDSYSGDSPWSGSGNVWIFKINLTTLAKTRWLFPKEYGESGTYSVAFASDNSVLVTSTFSGSGWIPLRRLAPDGTYRQLADVRQNTMLRASGDRDTIALAEANISSGDWGLYDVPTGELVYGGGTGQFNFEIATDRLGGQFAIPTYGGTYIYDAEYRLIARIGEDTGAQSIGVAYHPVENEIYLPWAGSGEVRVYSSTTLRHLRSINVAGAFEYTGNWGFVSGRTRMSSDGSLLMVTVPNGMRFLRMYTPLTAKNVQVRVAPGVASAIQLAGSIGNKGLLRYTLHQGPGNGTARVYGSRVSYTPKAGFTGTDRFVYRVHYGEATTTATVDILVE